MNIIIHFDEIYLKGNNQALFCRQLIKNLQALFKGARAKRVEGGLWLEGLEQEDLPRLALIPGIAAFAPAKVSGNKLAEIKTALGEMEFSLEVKKFRVSANRSYKAHPVSSREIEIAIGDYLRTSRGWQVDLKNFDEEVHVDIGRVEAVIYGKLREGAGGLPTGTTGGVLCLLSGGIDSPVAAYYMMKRGAEIKLIHFQNETKVTEEVGEKIFDLAKTLAGYQPVVKLLMVPFAELQRQVVMKISAKYRMIITRRLMFKIAEKVARQEKCLGLATGDSLGQVASQTLENMSAIYEATDMLKLNPLVGLNKKEIMKAARNLATLSISERPYEDCCSLFVAKHPETRAKISDILRLEQGLDLSTSALDKLKIISYNISMS